WTTSAVAAWHVLRANQFWAAIPAEPEQDRSPDNDAAAARAQMRKFYDLVARTHRETFDVDVAAEREIAWWRAHREHQHPDRWPAAADRQVLVDALAALCVHLDPEGEHGGSDLVSRAVPQGGTHVVEDEQPRRGDLGGEHLGVADRGERVSVQ